MKIKAFFFAVAVVSTGVSNAATYTVGNAGNGANASAVVTSTGVRLTGNGASGSVVGSAAIGVFSSDAAVLAATDGATLASSFTQAGSGFALFNNPITPTNYQGLFSVSTSLTGASLSPLSGQNVYLVISNASTIAGGTEFLVYKFNSQFITTDADTGQIIGFTIDTAIASDGTILKGSRTGPSSTLGGIDSSAEPSFQLAGFATVPEPSTMLLGALGALGLLRRRR